MTCFEAVGRLAQPSRRQEKQNDHEFCHRLSGAYRHARSRPAGDAPRGAQLRQLTDRHRVREDGGVARQMDRFGWDTLWLAEHHSQREVYEVTPNMLMFAVHLAHLTKDLKIGCGFNITPMWHRSVGLGRSWQVPSPHDALVLLRQGGTGSFALLRDSMDIAVERRREYRSIVEAWWQPSSEYAAQGAAANPRGR